MAKQIVIKTRALKLTRCNSSFGPRVEMEAFFDRPGRGGRKNGLHFHSRGLKHAFCTDMEEIARFSTEVLVWKGGLEGRGGFGGKRGVAPIPPYKQHPNKPS